MRSWLQFRLVLIVLLPGSLYAQSSIKCVGCERDAEGKIKRSESAKSVFRRTNPCPSTGRATGVCKGYEIDHKVPLYQGGADSSENMQWLSDTEHKAKHKSRSTGAVTASAPKAASPSAKHETTSSGGDSPPTYVGPRGGRYHYSKTGRKVYESSRRHR